MTQLNEQRKHSQITLEANHQQKTNSAIKPVQISSRGCFVKYLRQGKDYTCMFRLRCIGETLYSIQLIKARIDLMSLSLPGQVSLNKKFWL